ncbi:hypothetical protein ACFQZC_19875 [Streptacidiphilus monticola]
MESELPEEQAGGDAGQRALAPCGQRRDAEDGQEAEGQGGERDVTPPARR